MGGRPAFIVAALLTLTLLVSCSPLMLDVRVEGTALHPVIRVSVAREFLEAGPTTTEIRDLGVYEDRPIPPGARARDMRRYVWRIASADCQPASLIEYGVSPPHFGERIAAQALRENATYVVEVNGCDHLHNFGFGTFKIINGRIVRLN